MKYVIILCDGMADYPVEELEGMTPLQYAKTPNIDLLEKSSLIGMVKTIPDKMQPGSDTANLSIMGYDPEVYYSGRSPFEAASIGLNFSEKDTVFRCNLVTLSDDGIYEKKIMLDHSSDEITTGESEKLIDIMNLYFKTDSIQFYTGISYRNIMIWRNGPDEFKLTPPHDIIGREIGEYLIDKDNNSPIIRMMKKSSDLLVNHEVNIRRMEMGLRPANSMWIWGEGRKPSLPSFFDKYGLRGSVISAVDLIKGIGICAGLRSIDVEGATGNFHTNFRGKAEAAIKELKDGQDFVYIHIEAPDECGHRYEIKNKVRAIEEIDEKVIGIVKEELDKMDVDYKIMILPDHPTPLALRTHTRDAVPFMVYGSEVKIKNDNLRYNESSAKESKMLINEGHRLMDFFIKY